MKIDIACKVSIAGLLLSAALAHGSTVQAVNFDVRAGLSSGTINATKTSGDTLGDYDFDGNADDRASVLPMGTLFPPAAHPWYIGAVGQNNSAFYQGVGLARIDDAVTAAPILDMNRLAGSAAQVGLNEASASETLRIASAFFWKAEDFLGGNIELADEADSIQFTGSSAGANWNAHILIEAGEKWYVSASSEKSTLNLNGAAETWYEFDPVADNMFWDEANKGTGVIGSTLGEITSAGVYIQETYSGAKPYWNFESLSFSGTSIPEPGSYALLAGLAGLSFVMLRRR